MTGRAPGKPPAEIRLRDGSVQVRRLQAAEEAALYSELVHAGQPGLVELVTAKRLADGTLRMRGRSDRAGYLRAGDARALALGLAQARRRREEAFTSPLARPEAVPGKKAIKGGRVAWCDLDQGDGRAGLARLALPVTRCLFWPRLARLLAARPRTVRASRSSRSTADLPGALHGDPAAPTAGGSCACRGASTGKRGGVVRDQAGGPDGGPLAVERVGLGELPDPEPRSERTRRAAVPPTRPRRASGGSHRRATSP